MRSCLAAITIATAMIAPDASAAPGEHILVGDSVITPMVDVGVEYRTNVYQREIDPIGGANLRVAPGFEVNTKGPQTTFNARGQSELRYMLVAGTDNRANLDRFTDFTAGADLHLLTDQVLQFKFSENIGMKNNIAQAGWEDSPFHTQFRNELGLLAPIRVGPAIQIQPGGAWSFDDFRIPESGRVNDFRRFNRRNTLAAGLDLKWTFFPRTAAILEADYAGHLWDANLVSTSDGSNDAAANPYGDTVALPNSNFVKVQAGVRGRFTQRLVLIATAGYGVGLYNTTGGVPDTVAAIDVAGIDRIVGLVQGRFDLGPGNKLSLGYRKDFDDSWFANYLAYHHLYSRLENRFGPRFGTLAEVGVRLEGFAGQITRADQLLRVRGDLTYSVQDWLSISGGAWWTRRASSDNAIEYDDVNLHVLTNFTY